MTLAITPVDLVADREELFRALKRNLQEVSHEARLSWLYLEHPAGPARTWFIRDSTGEAVGVTSLFPRAVWLSGTAVVCGQVGDFGVDVGFRTLGPATMLQRATLEPVLRGELAFCYDCPPHEKGMAMFHRLGLKENCRMHLHVKLLRADRQLKRILGDGVGRMSAPVANSVLRMAGPGRKKRSGVEFSIHTGDFGPEFTVLDKAVASLGAVRIRRFAEDLNWRYRDNPLQQFETLTARQNGELIAYGIISITGNDASVIDLFGQELDEVGPALLQNLIELLRPRGLETIRSLVADDARSTAIFRQAGFSHRAQTTRVVAFSAPGSAADRALKSGLRWDLQLCDVMA
jgi:hypothetical protein